MKLSLVRGLEGEELDRAKSNFKSSGLIRELIVSRATEMIENGRVMGSSRKSYDTPNWPYLQADLIGYERAWREIISLIEK